MVGDDTDGNVPCVLFVILLACQLTDTVAQRTNGIYVKKWNPRPEQPLPDVPDPYRYQCFSVLIRCSCRGPSLSKLGEYVIPYFHISVAVAANGTSRLAAAVFFAAVIINLRAGTAGA